MTSENLKGSPFCAYPMEGHVFDGIDYLCRVCGRPRAMHIYDGFIPSRIPERVTFDPKASFRGHPYFRRAGSII